MGSYITGISQAEAFSERLKRELQALEAANVHAILESEPLIDEVQLFWVDYDLSFTGITLLFIYVQQAL